MSERYWDPVRKRIVSSDEEATPLVRRETAGPLAEAASFTSDAQSWNDSIKAACDVRGCEVPEALLRRDADPPFAREQEPSESLAKRRVLKSEFWIKKLKSGEIEISEEFLDALEHRDPRSARFLRKLIAVNRRLMGEDEE